MMFNVADDDFLVIVAGRNAFTSSLPDFRNHWQTTPPSSATDTTVILGPPDFMVTTSPTPNSSMNPCSCFVAPKQQMGVARVGSRGCACLIALQRPVHALAAHAQLGGDGRSPQALGLHGPDRPVVH